MCQRDPQANTSADDKDQETRQLQSKRRAGFDDQDHTDENSDEQEKDRPHAVYDCSSRVLKTDRRMHAEHRTKDTEHQVTRHHIKGLCSGNRPKSVHR